MTAEVWAILGVGVTLLGVILATWMASGADNRAAHTEIGKNVGRVEKKVDDGFAVVNADIKGLIRSVGRLEGPPRTTGRPSEGGRD